MAVIDALIPSASSDVVAIFPETDPIDLPDIGEFNLPGIGALPSLTSLPGFIPVQVFGDARPTRVQVSEPSRFMVHPLESGGNITDHRVIDPVELSIQFIFRPETFRTTYFLIRQAFRAALRFSIQTKTNTYTGMYMADIPHEETVELFDTISMIILFREVQFFDAQLQQLAPSNVVNDVDASTVFRGEQQSSTPSAGQESRGSVLFETFGDFF